MSLTEANIVKPWYRQFFPWLLIAILGWGIVSSLITLSVAVGNPPQMMTGDYEPLGKVMVDTHRRSDRAEALGLNGQLLLDQSQWRLHLDVEGSLDANSLLLRVQHPTDAQQDQQFVLKRAPDLRWVAVIDDPASLPPRGRMIVSDLVQSWWISGSYTRDGREPLDIQLVPERL